MDINTIDESRVEGGAELTLNHPITGKPTDIVITLASVHSQTYRQRLFELARERSNRDNEDKPARSEREIGNTTLAAVTLKWKGLHENGKAVKCTRENAERIYRENDWIYRQVDNFVAQDRNFFRESPTD